VGEGGAPVVELPGGEDYTITDNGSPGDPDADPPIPPRPPKTYTVSENGTVTQGETAKGGTSTTQNTNGVDTKGEATDIRAQGVIVTFTKATSTKYPNKYGFDAYTSRYPKTKGLYKKLGANYYVPYKSVAKGKVDYIIANIDISTDSIQPSDIIFKTKDGLALKKVDSTSTSYTLELKGVFTDADVEVQAVIQQNGTYQVAGAFIQYQATTKNVAVVLVNTIGANTERIKNIKEKVQQIYQQGLVSFSFTEISDFDINLHVSGDIIESGESGFAAQYTSQQRDINNKLKAHLNTNYKQNAYYIILTDKKPSTAGEKGIMPLGRQFGYIFTSNAPPSGAGGPVAHELGHGAFQLKHPFSTHSYGWAENDTDWLMDYSNSEKLPYVQWKAIQNTKLRIGVFDGDGEAESTQISSLPNGFENKDKTYTFMTLNGSFITLPPNIKQLTFVSGLDDFEPFIRYPTGALLAFTLDNEKKSAEDDERFIASTAWAPLANNDSYSVEDFEFTYKGFKSKKNQKPYIDESRKKYSGHVITFSPRSNAKRLRLTNIPQLNFEEETKVNILHTNSDYIKFNKILNGSLENKNDYAYTKTTPYDFSFALDEKLIKHFLGDHLDWNKKYLLMSKLAVLNNSFYPIIDSYYPKLDISIRTSKYAYEALNKKSPEELVPIYIKLINAVKNGVKDCTETLSNLTINTPFTSINRCIKEVSDDELKDLSVANKIIALSILTNWKVVTDNSTEVGIVRLLKFTKNKDIDALFNGLRGMSKVDNEQYLLKQLTYSVDNDHTWLGNDNYLEMLKVFTSLTLKSEKFKEQAKAYGDKLYNEYAVNFYHKDFWDNAFEIPAIAFNFPYVSSKPETKVKWVDTDSLFINIQNAIASSKFIIPITEPLTVDPFSPIWFINKSSLSMLSDYNKELPLLAPAFLAYFANDVGNTSNIIDGINAAVDVASLTSGYGVLLKGPSIVKKVYILADMLGSGVSLVTTIAADNLNQETKDWLNTLNILTAVIAVDELSGNLKNFNTLFNKVKKNQKKLPSKEEINAFLENTLSQKTTPEILAKAGKNKIQEAKVWLKHIEAEGATNSKVSNYKKKAQEARKKLNLAENIIIGVEEIRNIKKSEFIASVRNFPSDKIDEAWSMFKEENWIGLKKLFIENNLNNGWPPYYGFSKIYSPNLSISKIANGKSSMSNKFDRFQNPGDNILKGGFASPVKQKSEGIHDLHFTYNTRMLNTDIVEGSVYFKFSFSKEVTDFEIKHGDVLPWSNNIDEINLKGEQVMFTKRLQEIKNEYLKVEEAMISVKGKWRKCVFQDKEILINLQQKINAIPDVKLADELVDYINKTQKNRDLFKKAEMQDQLISAWLKFKKSKITIPNCN
jgi:hypothetical protein